jgi:hypothetical protein
MTAHSSAGNPLQHWLRSRPRGWWFVCWLTLGISEFAAIFAQRDSRVHVVAPPPGAVPTLARYDAGWPFVYAHVRTQPLTFAQWRSFVQHAPPRSGWSWPTLIIDIGWTGIIFALAIALAILAWQLARRAAQEMPRAQYTRLVLVVLTVAGAWFAIAVTVVGNINATQPTDEATWRHLTPPVTFAALLPGALSFIVQRGFEGDGGLGIALANGPSAYVELAMVLLVAVVLPAGLLTSAILTLQHAWARFRRSPEPPSAGVRP